MTVRNYDIKVKGQDPEQFVVRETHRGPLLPSSLLKEAQVLFSNKVPLPDDMQFDLSIAWSGLTSGESMFGILRNMEEDIDMYELRDKVRG
jgi:acyl-homoserine lactone acylase PvdQ